MTVIRTSIRTSRAACWVGAMLLALTPLPWLGLGAVPAEASVAFATVNGHEPFSSDANHPEYWGDDCRKVQGADGSISYLLTDDYALVVVKAAAQNVDPFANTLFTAPSAGETVWADTNGSFSYDPGGRDGDKEISHVIVCDSETTPTPTVTETTPTPTDTETTPTPTDTETTPTPTDTETTGPATPTDFGSTGAATPNGSGPAGGAETDGASAAQLASTGSGLPVAGAVAISALLLGLGLLLVLGSGRLPAIQRRRH